MRETVVTILVPESVVAYGDGWQVWSNGVVSRWCGESERIRPATAEEAAEADRNARTAARCALRAAGVPVPEVVVVRREARADVSVCEAVRS